MGQYLDIARSVQNKVVAPVDCEISEITRINENRHQAANHTASEIREISELSPAQQLDPAVIAIRRWLAYIGETHQPIIEEVMEMIATDPAALAYYLTRSAEVPTPDPNNA